MNRYGEAASQFLGKPASILAWPTKIEKAGVMLPEAPVIEKFVADNKTSIDERKNKLANGEVKDAFLLILTPAKDINFYNKSKEKIECIVAKYQPENRYFSEDYYRILNYYSLANNSQNNFSTLCANHFFC